MDKNTENQLKYHIVYIGMVYGLLLFKSYGQLLNTALSGVKGT